MCLGLPRVPCRNLSANQACSGLRKVVSVLFEFFLCMSSEKGSFQKSQFSRDTREFRDSRDCRELPECGKQR